jgi:hypothetical protein
VLDVTVLPAASCTTTTGWVANGVPAAAPDGLVRKASFAAAPGDTVNDVLTAEARAPDLAVRV